MSLLPQSELHKIHRAAVEAGLGRSALLATLDRSVTNSLATDPIPSQQLLCDIATLNDWGLAAAAAEAEPPLIGWLRNALVLAAPRPRQLAVFGSALEAALRAQAQAAGPSVPPVGLEPLRGGGGRADNADVLNRLKATVARLTAGEKQGTAFLVSPTHALTAAHCVQGAVRVDLRFGRWVPAARTAVVEAVDALHDVALLRLDDPADATPLPLARGAYDGALWSTFAHPAPTEYDGLVLQGTVVDADALAYGERALQVASDAAADSVKGASGAPVVVDGRVVAILTLQLVDAGVRPMFEALYAVPLDAVPAAWLPALEPALQPGSAGQARAARP